MTDQAYLKRLFQTYYSEKQMEISGVNSYQSREFGFIPWDKQIMIRHKGFNELDLLRSYLIENGPRHVYSSGTLYLQPDHDDMEGKGYLGCDLIIDIDVDHFPTPCKEDHDIWQCKDCGKTGKGMHKDKCKCGSSRFKTLAWICEECLEIAKDSIKSLIYNYLIPDFGIKESELKVAFSGHRGYHIKVENEKIRTLSSDGRREIVDYLSGNNISFEILGLKNAKNNIYGLRKENIGWSQKIVKKIEDVLNRPRDELEILLHKFGISNKRSQSFLNNKDDFLQVISNQNNPNIWSIEGFGFQTWKIFLNGIVNEIGVEIDEPVTIDIHRLIRYPGSLHGKSGFKVQELTLDELEGFLPLNEANEKLDPVVFKSTNILQKLEIVEPQLPQTKMKDESFGPYEQGEIIEVPHHVAIFLLCKGVATLI